MWYNKITNIRYKTADKIQKTIHIRIHKRLRHIIKIIPNIIIGIFLTLDRDHNQTITIVHYKNITISININIFSIGQLCGNISYY